MFWNMEMLRRGVIAAAGIGVLVGSFATTSTLLKRYDEHQAKMAFAQTMLKLQSQLGQLPFFWSTGRVGAGFEALEEAGKARQRVNYAGANG